MIKLFKIVLYVSIFASFVAHSESSTDDMLKQIQDRAAKVKQFKQLLNNPDQTVRVSALDVMLKSDDSVMRELAFGLGFASADDVMRAIALKNKITYMKQLNFNLTLTNNPTEKSKKGILEKFSNNYPVEVKGYNSNTGAFTTNYRDGRGQISGSDITLQSKYCNANIRLSESASLKGILKCHDSSYEGNYLMELQLQ